MPSDDEKEGSCDSDFDPIKENIKELNDDVKIEYFVTRKRKRSHSPKRRSRKESIESSLTKIMNAFVESSKRRSELLNQKLLASCQPCGETSSTDGNTLLKESIWREIFLNMPLNRQRGVVLNL
ncbi:hypothetical protein LIER_20417 [Lithospermum erythrorhizon]|uniref:Uncharacterized protein n=1 Tax=Lithospermum erythrorhizon TaxID=34254 RepID=A0AAV3QPI1_LITER